MRRFNIVLWLLAISLSGYRCPVEAQAVAAGDGWLRSAAALELRDEPTTFRSHVEAGKPFTVAGPCGALIGEQDGTFEAWIFPVKILSGMHIEAHVAGYDVPIDVNRDAAEIEVAFDHTTITYTHIAFTLKETLFATRCDRQDGTGVMAVFELHAVRPVTLTLSFTPEVRRMWPAPVSGEVNPEWVRTGGSKELNDTTRPGGKGARYGPGWYMLHTDFDDLAAALAMPDAEPGILPPYQEKPATYPLQFVLHYDPVRDAGRSFPLLMAVSTNRETATREALASKLAELGAHVADLYHADADYYDSFVREQTSIETPDAELDRDVRWAEVAIDQMGVRSGGEMGLVAGLYSSGSSARPGFGWFFGRDALYTTWAINSYGDFARTRAALSFLIKRQRDDGKMPHEFSQSAAFVNWGKLPYEYAAADSTPLFLMAMEDYLKASGDLEFVLDNWHAVEKAWNFESHHDTDGDGILDNAQGTGWVESWPQGMPHQEIYLAALDEQGSWSMEELSRAMGRQDTTRQAAERARELATKIPSEYAEANGMYAFSRNADGTLDATASVFPAIAWWNGGFGLPDADVMFRRWDSAEFSTDWGMRDVGAHEAVYDSMSYHQGSVWPLFTGWASLAEYRTGRDLAAYAHLMENVHLTTEQDIGAVTELLSGAFYVPFGRSTSHQMWSSAMVLIPALRGLFGIMPDALGRTITVDPQLPAQWDHASVRRVHVGGAVADLEYARVDGKLIVHLESADPKAAGLKLKPGPLAARAGATISASGRDLMIPLPEVEVGLVSDYPLPGSMTLGVKVIEEMRDKRGLTLTIEGQADKDIELMLRRNEANVKLLVDGATVRGDRLWLRMPAGRGYRRQTIHLRW